MRYVIAVVVVLIIIVGVGAFWFVWNQPEAGPQEPQFPEVPEDQGIEDDESDQQATTTDEQDGDLSQEVLGSSVEDRDIMVHRYGNGEDELLFVGGIHGGYSWNTTAVARDLMDYLESNPEAVPENVTVSVIPALNPDGLYETFGTTEDIEAEDAPAVSETVSGRFNASGVDLNRNFACNWKSTGTWQDRQVDGGDEPFSEPESQVLRDYVQQHEPQAAVVYYSASGDVVASNCNGDITSETSELVSTYADVTNYTARESFDYYELSGDAANWMAKIGVPAISVVLETHNSAEWQENKAGIEAVLERYAS